MTNPATEFPLPHFDDDTFPQLRYVDWYDTTTFNANQMLGVIPELERLLEDAHGRVAREGVGTAKIKAKRHVRMLKIALELARQCQQNRGRLYLVFTGD